MNRNEKKVFKFNIKNKKLLFIVIGVLCVVIISTFATTGIVKYINYKKAEGMEEISCKTYELKGNEATTLVTFAYKDGIEKITDFQNHTLYCHGRTIVGVDYNLIDHTIYKFKMEYSDGVKKDLILNYDIPRGPGNYVFSHGIYVYEPTLSTGFNQLNTRYLIPNEDSTRLVAGNFIKDEPTDDWYDYKNSRWANIYVESDGYAIEYVWIPRYAYKLDETNQTTDVKFINTDNEYWDEYGNITKWNELQEQGYKIPDAFSFKMTRLPGYWAMKYVMQNTTNEVIINYDLNVRQKKALISNIRLNTSEIPAKYQVSINGDIKLEILPENINNQIELEGLKEDENYVTLTALTENGEIIGSMTQTYKITKPNPPQLKNEKDEWAFNPETTYYVTYTYDGIEDSSIPISQKEPENWYDYGEGRWANIVTKNNEGTIYYTWIPRYEYTLTESDKAAEKTTIRFLQDTSTETTPGYKIPDAFKFKGKELKGYWAMKYVMGQ